MTAIDLVPITLRMIRLRVLELVLPLVVVPVWLWLLGVQAIAVLADELPVRRAPATHWKTDGRPKVTYPSRRVAEQNARQIRGRGGDRLYPYRCAECPGWHLSSSPRRTAP